MDHPLDLPSAMTRFSGDLVALQMHMWKRAFGMPDRDVAPPHSDDQRFADPEWSKHPFWDSIKQAYLTYDARRRGHGVFDARISATRNGGARRSGPRRCSTRSRRPTSSGPIRSRCRSSSRAGARRLARGLEQFIEDVRAGDLRMVDPEPFQVGKNLATTPGAVVFRNRLLEVIQYKPLCDQVHEVPVVLIAPWINKFYILDLDPKKSLVRYLLEQGFTVFVTSWRNPPADMAEVRFEDYLTDGVDAIVDMARSISACRACTPSATAWAAPCSRSTWRGSIGAFRMPDDMPIAALDAARVAAGLLAAGRNRGVPRRRHRLPS